MKIEKAIEHLNAIKDSGEYLGDPDDSAAIKLGIEALEWLNQWTGVNSPLSNVKLPGETKD